jgi:5'-deoxynucleotidase YfbR-like HD superfamily hydrolase
MSQRLDQQFAFLLEADKLKTVLRSSTLVDNSRPENSAEHSWHLALYAMCFADIATGEVDVNRAIKMLLLHDIVEIDAGDHPIHIDVDDAHVAVIERRAAERIFALLPADPGENFLELWLEFEAAQSPDARFAKMLDHSQPIFQALFAGPQRADHIDIVRNNLQSGRASRFAQSWPQGHAFMTAALSDQSTARPEWARLKAQVNFLCEADRLKSILRATPITDNSRRENSGEHSWHIALYAMTLADQARDGVQISRVIQMLLLHDIVEIDAGDAPIHGDFDAAEQEAKEQAAADRIFNLLPADMAAEFRAIWDEFEAAETADAVFAKSIDRVQPLLLNMASGGGSWNDYDVTIEQIDQRVGVKVMRGSPDVWHHIRARVAPFFEKPDK